jgi:hypothetical protein
MEFKYTGLQKWWWIRLMKALEVKFFLKDFILQVQELETSFTKSPFKHIYRENNTMVEELDKRRVTS